MRAADAFRVTWSERRDWERVRHQDCGGKRRTGTTNDNVYHSVREKQQGNVVYRQRILQTVTSLRVVSLVFRGHDLLKIANINLQQEATLWLWKNPFPERAPEMEPSSWLTPKRLFVQRAYGVTLAGK